MKSLQEKLALLDETAAFYTSETLCMLDGPVTDGARCRYHIDGKAGCAVGRLIADKELCKRLDASTITGVVAVFELFPTDVQEYGKNFLVALQGLHDDSDHWTSTGLSEDGRKRVAEIRQSLEGGAL